MHRFQVYEDAQLDVDFIQRRWYRWKHAGPAHCFASMRGSGPDLKEAVWGLRLEDLK